MSPGALDQVLPTSLPLIPVFYSIQEGASVLDSLGLHLRVHQ
jgi:hypothetical protein